MNKKPHFLNCDELENNHHQNQLIKYPTINKSHIGFILDNNIKKLVEE